MKKHLFTKFLALFLSGAMLAGVGCKDYDDDIDKINERLDGLEVTTGKIASIEQQLSAVQTSVDNLKTAENEIRNLISTLRTDVNANKTAISNLESAQSQLKTQIGNLETKVAGYPTSETVQGMIDATLATYGTLDEIKDAVALAKNLNAYDTDAKIEAAINAAQSAAVSAAGEALTEAFKTKTGAIYNAVSGEIQAQIAAAESEFDGKITTAIEDACKNGGEINNLIGTAIASATQEFENKLAAIKKDINAVAGMIQSLVYVPDHVDGKATLNSYEFSGAAAGAMLDMKFRVTPAKLAADLTPEALKLVVEQVSAVTRAAAPAPAATITKVTPSEANDGTFLVSAYVTNFPADVEQTISVALAANYNIDIEGGSGDVTVENNIMSNYVGIYKPSVAQPINFALFADGAEKPFDFATAYEMPWTKSVAESSVALLNGLTLKVSFDGKNYMTLEDAALVSGASFAVSAYTLGTPAYFSDAACSAAIQASASALKVSDNTGNVWNTKLAKVGFKKVNETSAVVGQSVQIAHTLKVKINGAEKTVIDAEKTTYTIGNAEGAKLSFADQTLPWSYAFVSANNNTTDPTPAITATTFSEILVSGDFAGKKLSEIMAATPKITIEPALPATGAATLTHVASVVGQGIQIALSDYEWDKEYTIKAVYTVDGTDHVITGKVTTGAEPKDIEYAFAAENMIYNAAGMKKSVADWSAIFANTANPMNAFFKDAAEFAGALFAGTQTDNVTKTTYTEKGKQPANLDLTNGSQLTLAAGKLEGVVNKADVKTVGDKFEESAEFTTWYGQKVKVSMTFTIATKNQYALVAQPAFVENQTVGSKGSVGTTSEKWEIIQVKMENFFTPNVQPAAGEGTLTISYEPISEDGKPAAGDVYPTVNGTTLAWGATANQRSVQIKAIMKLDDLVLDTEEFTVETADPIKTFAQAKASEVTYKAGVETTVNLLKGISLIDDKDTPWIKADGTLVKTKTNQYTAKDVFGATTGSAATAGIEFGDPVATYPDGSKATLEALSIDNDGQLIFKANDAILRQDITVTIPATFKYQLGDKDGRKIDVKVVIKK